ncbi:c-type cytochrome [Sphingomonas sp. Sphisp140]|uniref:c-type cytochrome n=1 Tax=unclassified Sphingomonas TaxID=196159 RepID=UPI0039B02A65
MLLSAAAPLCMAAPARPAVPPESGRALYAAQCASCHGRAFEGMEDGPSLIGARFQAKWRDRPDALYAKIRQSMPQDDPGTLTPAEAGDLTALLLAANHLPARPK